MPHVNFMEDQGPHESEEKKEVAAYCKCGGIIYYCTLETYNNGDGKKEIDEYFDKGFAVGKVTEDDSYGCKCRQI